MEQQQSSQTQNSSFTNINALKTITAGGAPKEDLRAAWKQDGTPPNAHAEYPTAAHGSTSNHSKQVKDAFYKTKGTIEGVMLRLAASGDSLRDTELINLLKGQMHEMESLIENRDTQRVTINNVQHSATTSSPPPPFSQISVPLPGKQKGSKRVRINICSLKHSCFIYFCSPSCLIAFRVISQRKRAKASPSNELYCRSCGDTQTCEWRRGPDGYKSYVVVSVVQ